VRGHRRAGARVRQHERPLKGSPTLLTLAPLVYEGDSAFVPLEARYEGFAPPRAVRMVRRQALREFLNHFGLKGEERDRLWMLLECLRECRPTGIGHDREAQGTF
jgi:hypothetical protein